jgi:hypothetical protein
MRKGGNDTPGGYTATYPTAKVRGAGRASDDPLDRAGVGTDPPPGAWMGYAGAGPFGVWGAGCSLPGYMGVSGSGLQDTRETGHSFIHSFIHS